MVLTHSRRCCCSERRYKRIEFITTVLVAASRLRRRCALLLGDRVSGAVDIADGFSLKVFSLPAAAIALAFSTFGSPAWCERVVCYPYWCLEKGYARFTGPRSDIHSGPSARLAPSCGRPWSMVFTAATVAYFLSNRVAPGLASEGPR
jgi:hypothetical protein